jgi:hypothetical protein
VSTCGLFLQRDVLPAPALPGHLLCTDHAAHCSCKFAAKQTWLWGRARCLPCSIGQFYLGVCYLWVLTSSSCNTKGCTRIAMSLQAQNDSWSPHCDFTPRSAVFVVCCLLQLPSQHHGWWHVCCNDSGCRRHAAHATDCREKGVQ